MAVLEPSPITTRSLMPGKYFVEGSVALKGSREMRMDQERALLVWLLIGIVIVMLE
jgi:hypothetical protein